MKLFMLIMWIILDHIKVPVIVPNRQQDSCTLFMFSGVFSPPLFPPSFLSSSFLPSVPSFLPSFLSPFSSFFLLNNHEALVRAKSLQSCLTLCDPMACSLPCSSIHGILQASVPVCIAISFSRGSSQPRDPTPVSCIVRWILYHWATWEALIWLLKWKC